MSDLTERLSTLRLEYRQLCSGLKRLGYPDAAQPQANRIYKRMAQLQKEAKELFKALSYEEKQEVEI